MKQEIGQKDLFSGIKKNIKKNNESNNVLPMKKEDNIYNLFPNIKLELIHYSNDKKLNKFLAEKSLKIKTLQANASVILGEVFQEVKTEIGRKPDREGLYVEWLENNGYNKMTALRHRNRYTLFKTCKKDVGKLTVATLPIKLIQEITKIKEDGRRVDLLKKIDAGADREEIEDILGIIDAKIEDSERDLVKKIDIYDFLDEDKIKGITDINELHYWTNKHKEFSDIIKKSKDVLLNKEVELSNNKTLEEENYK